MKFTIQDGLLRLYDGTGTAYYLDLDFDDGNLTAPMGQPRQDENLWLHRNKAGSDMHYTKGSDEKLMAPLTLTISATMTDSANTKHLIHWLMACNDGGTTTVNSNTVATSQADTQRDGSNANPVFADSNKLTCNLEYLLDTGGTDVHYAWNEIWFPMDEQSISESDDVITINLTGYIYGTIAFTTAGAFGAGTDIEA